MSKATIEVMQVVWVVDLETLRVAAWKQQSKETVKQDVLPGVKHCQ